MNEISKGQIVKCKLHQDSLFAFLNETEPNFFIAQIVTEFTPTSRSKMLSQMLSMQKTCFIIVHAQSAPKNPIQINDNGTDCFSIIVHLVMLYSLLNSVCNHCCVHAVMNICICGFVIPLQHVSEQIHLLITSLHFSSSL